MTNVLIIPTSGVLEFNASAAAGGAPATLDSAYANAVRLEIASSATLKVTGKNASENKRLVVNGTNGDVLTVRDTSSTTEGATASLTTPVFSATVISATTYYNLPGGPDLNLYVENTGDTMTGPLILDGSAQTHLMLSSDGSMYASGYVSATSGVFSNLSSTGTVSSTGNQLAVGEMSSTGAHRGSSGIFTATLQAPTVSGTTGTFATQVTSPTVSGTTGTFATQVVSPTVSGGTLTVTGNASVTGTVSSTGNQLSLGDMSSTGAHRGSSGIFTTTVQAPTLSGGTLTLTGNATVVNLSATGAISSTGNQLAVGEMSSTGAHRGSSGIFTTTVQAPTLSGGTLTVTGNASVTGTVSSTGNQLAAGDMSSTGAHRGSSGIFTTTVQAPTISGTTGTFATQVVSPTVSGTTGTFATQVVSPTVSGTTGTFATQVTAPTVSATNISALTNIRGGNISGTDISALTNIRGGNISGTTVSGLSANITNISATDLSAATVKGGTSISGAAVSAVSGRFTDLSSTSALALTISGTNISALTNVRGGNVSADTVSANTHVNTPSLQHGTLVTVKVGINTLLSMDTTSLNTDAPAVNFNGANVNVTNGDLSVTGNFKATAKSFLIDHPTPNSGYSKLQYACLEGPENGVYVRGKADTAQTDHVALPNYWVDLVHASSITVQITPTHYDQRLYVEKVEDNKVYVKDIMGSTNDVAPKTEYYYIVYGERKDIGHLTVEY